jgi:hypothetical protein
MNTLARDDSSVPFMPSVTCATVCHSSARDAASSISFGDELSWPGPGTSSAWRRTAGVQQRAAGPRRGALGRAQPAHAVGQPGGPAGPARSEAAARRTEHRVVADANRSRNRIVAMAAPTVPVEVRIRFPTASGVVRV